MNRIDRCCVGRLLVRIAVLAALDKSTTTPNGPIPGDGKPDHQLLRAP